MGREGQKEARRRKEEGGTRTCWNMSGGAAGRTRGRCRQAREEVASWSGRRNIPDHLGSPEPWKSSYPEVNELVVTLKLLVFPSI